MLSIIYRIKSNVPSVNALDVEVVAPEQCHVGKDLARLSDEDGLFFCSELDCSPIGWHVPLLSTGKNDRRFATLCQPKGCGLLRR